MRLFAVGLAALWLLVCATVVCADVADYVGKPVQSIAVEIDGRPSTDAALKELIQNRIGAPFAMTEVRETIAHFFGLGRYQDVRVRAALSEGGVSIVYALVPVQTIGRVAFAMSAPAPGVKRSDLKRAVVERYGTSPPIEQVADAAHVVEAALAERGYLRAVVSPQVQPDGPAGRASLVFAIDPGSRTRIGTVELAGAAAPPSRQLVEQLGVKPGQPYLRDDVQRRIERYLEERRQRGYYEARASVTPRLTDDDRMANMTLSLSDGPRVRVVFKGDSLPDGNRDELVPTAREGSADEDLLEDSSHRIEEALHAQGFRDAVAPHAREEVQGDLVITFDVKRGRQYRVSNVEITGNSAIPLAELAPGLRAQADRPFSDASLDRDVERIQDLYHRRGFAAVRVESAVEPFPQTGDLAAIPVTVRIVVTEGPQTIVGSVHVQGNQSVPEATLSRELGLQPGRPFFLTQLAVDRDAIQLAYANLGYPNASVDSNPGLSADTTRADVVFAVREGPRIVVDHVLIVGNERTRRETIQRELQLGAGNPMGLAAVNESQRRLAALGLFRRVRLTELGHGDETTRDLLVAVEEAPATTISYGGGVEAGMRARRTEAQNGVAEERLEVAPRAFFQIGRRNLFGKNRSVNLFSSLSLRPKDSPFFADQPQSGGDGSGFGFSEYRVLGTFREPRVLGTAADAFLTGTTEQQIRSSFNFARRAFTGEVARRLTPRVSVSANYQIQRTELFDERINPADKLLVDRIFPQVRLSSFSGSVFRDVRDDPADPASGSFLSANAQVAGRRIGSEVGLAKSFYTVQSFHALPRSHRTVFAASARLGLATGFPRSVEQTDEDNQPIIGADGQPVLVTVRDLPASERFFAGGDTTVRGFALDQLGTPNTIDKDGFPIGGNALVIFNAELRTPVRSGLGLVGFFDSGNVFARTGDINLTELRSSIGFGVRYKSPVGPIRVDLGFKIHRRETAPGVQEKLTALHISLGQAF